MRRQVFAAAIVVLGAASSGLAADPPRNVVLIVADDLGFQVGCYGDGLARTPGIDRLAAAGTRFTRAYATTSSCSASRSVLLTGLYNHATGHYGHSHSYHHFSTYDSIQTLPVILAEAGYRTCSIGKYHVAPEAVYHFEQYRNEGIQGSRNPVAMAKNAKAWIAQRDQRPFFLYFCTTDPHRSGPQGFANRNDVAEPYPGVKRLAFDPDRMVVPAWLPNQPEVRDEFAEFYQSISRLDQGVTALLDALVELGHWDDTLLIFLSDNGPPFPGAKTTLNQPGIHLPLIVRQPAQQKTGIATDAMVTWADVTPTILDYCRVTPKPAPPIVPGPNAEPSGPLRGKPLPVHFHGRSFLPVLEQEHPQGWDEVYASHTFHEVPMYYPMRAIIKGNVKLIMNLAHELPFPFASDLYASPTWQGVLKRGDGQFGARTVDAYLHRPRYELYDLGHDPYELQNLASDPHHQDALKRLQAKLKTWQQETKDPWIVKYEHE